MSTISTLTSPIEVSDIGLARNTHKPTYVHESSLVSSLFVCRTCQALKSSRKPSLEVAQRTHQTTIRHAITHIHKMRRLVTDKHTDSGTDIF